MPPVAAAAVPTQFVTLGSLDPESGYRMLVTLTNAGAAVRRAEMTSPRFRDQHDRSGYLGELELNDVDGGVEVQVVGAGTPAAAGRHRGRRRDRRHRRSDKPSMSKRSTNSTRRSPKTKPGQEITLQVRRGDGAPQPRDGEAGAAAARGAAAGNRKLSRCATRSRRPISSIRRRS